jgi:O-antigen/teichoic acid export membrane protein
MSILTGRGAFSQRALPTAARMLGRMVLIFVLVGLGLSITGAVLASIGASIVQLLTARIFVRPKLLGKPVLPAGLLAGYALPLFLFGVGMRLFNQLGLWMVKGLGQDPAMAGFYGAAQNLTAVPSLFAISLAPLLLATLSRLFREQQTEQAQTMMQQGMRLILCMLPFAGLAAGSAPEIMALIYGRAFLPAAPMLALLIFAAVALAMVTVTGGMLTAASRPAWSFALTWPLMPLAFAALLVVIPRFGATGAAAVTTILAYGGAVAMMLGVYRRCGAAPKAGTVIRTFVVTVLAFALSLAWHTRGLWVIAEIVVVACAILLGLLALGELTSQDLAFAQSLFSKRRPRLPAATELDL